MQNILLQFHTVFQTSKGLPPLREHDHKIMLLDEGQTVKIRHYKCSAIQKDEIEKMVAKIKEARIIKDSSSSFASPIVLVKKKDGS